MGEGRNFLTPLEPKKTCENNKFFQQIFLIPKYSGIRGIYTPHLPSDRIHLFSVVQLRLVFDRDTGKPKGYGFCEYVDQDTAASAIRNLNGFELHGRPIRVDSAAGSERNKEEVRRKDPYTVKSGR